MVFGQAGSFESRIRQTDAAAKGEQPPEVASLLKLAATNVLFPPVTFYRRNGRQMILADSIESDSIEAVVPKNAMLTALAKAYAWQEQLESGQFEGLADIAKEQGVDRSHVGRMLQLTSLAPDIVESILAGQAFADISLQHCRKGIPVFWEEQRRVLVPNK
ncbi:MAG: hypothetical protein ACKO3T_21740 [Planctomycetaceae bacterium]